MLEGHTISGASFIWKDALWGYISIAFPAVSQQGQRVTFRTALLTLGSSVLRAVTEDVLGAASPVHFWVWCVPGRVDEWDLHGNVPPRTLWYPEKLLQEFYADTSSISQEIRNTAFPSTKAFIACSQLINFHVISNFSRKETHFTTQNSWTRGNFDINRLCTDYVNYNWHEHIPFPFLHAQHLCKKVAYCLKV